MFIDGLGSGGAQRQFALLASGLVARGHRVTVAVYTDQAHFAGELHARDIEIVRLPKRRRFSTGPLFGIARLYRRRHAEAVIAFLRAPAATAELARLIYPGMRVIAAERASFPGPTISWPVRLLQNLHRLSDFVTVNSRHHRLRMQREFPFLAGRLVTINNAVILPKQPAKVPPGTGDSLRLVALASLMPYKNSVVLARALALLRKEFGIRAEISWVGETFQHMPGYGTFAETCAILVDQGIEDQWAWLGVREDVDRILAQHDALIHTSSQEGASNAVCEALALGMPVLAGRIADHESMIEKPNAGLLFDPDDERSIAETIVRFSKLSRETRAKMGRSGRALIANENSAEQMVSQYELLVERVITGFHTLPSQMVGEPKCAA